MPRAVSKMRRPSMSRESWAGTQSSCLTYLLWSQNDARHRHGPNHCHDLCQSSVVARRSPTSRCICDHLGTEACRRRPTTSWPAGRCRLTSSAIAGRSSTCPPAERSAGRPLWRGSARLYPVPRTMIGRRSEKVHRSGLQHDSSAVWVERVKLRLNRSIGRILPPCVATA